jgi:hypothetical protein
VIVQAVASIEPPNRAISRGTARTRIDESAATRATAARSRTRRIPEAYAGRIDRSRWFPRST